MEKLLPYMTAIIAIGGFIFSVWKYIDLKDREEERLNYENFDKTLSNLSGELLPDGNIKIEISFLIGNLYKLIEFKKYKHISLPVLKYMKECPINTDEKSLNQVDIAIDEVIKLINQ